MLDMNIIRKKIMNCTDRSKQQEESVLSADRFLAKVFAKYLPRRDTMIFEIFDNCSKGNRHC